MKVERYWENVVVSKKKTIRDFSFSRESLDSFGFIVSNAIGTIKQLASRVFVQLGTIKQIVSRVPVALGSIKQNVSRVSIALESIKPKNSRLLPEKGNLGCRSLQYYLKW